MPDNPLNSLYPQPSQQQPGLFNQNPLALIPAITQLQDLAARRAVGQATQGAIGPGGVLDPSAAITAVGNNPAAALRAPEAVGTLLQQRQQQIQNQTSQFTLAAGQNSALANWVAGLASNPNISPDEVRSQGVAMAARTGIPASMVTSLMQGMPQKGGKPMQQFWANITNATQGASATAAQVPAGVGPQGEVYTAPAGAVTSQGGTQQTLPAGQAPLIAASREELGNDQSKSAAILQNTRPLAKALGLLGDLSNRDFGPASANWAKFRGAFEQAGIIQPGSTDLEAQQQFEKYVSGYTANAFNASRSNEALNQAIKSTPNSAFTKGANLELLKNQIGFDRMDAALPLAFKAQNPSSAADANYKSYKAGYYPGNDSEAYKYDLMTPAQQAAKIKSLGPRSKDNQVYMKFMTSLHNAHAAGVLDPQGGGGGGQ